MNTWARGLLLAGGALLALAALTALIVWWFNTYTRTERSIDLPPQGEAAYNPLYLLAQALHIDDVDAEAWRYLQLDEIPLWDEDTLVLYGDPRQLSKHETERLLAWVKRGGHLIVRLSSSRGATRSSAALLDALGIRQLPESSQSCQTITLSGATQMRFCADERFALDRDRSPALALGDEDSGYTLVRLARGRGMVDVLSQLTFLDNTQLKKPGRAEFARQLLAPNYGEGTVHLIYGNQLPLLWQLIFDHGRMAWIPLLLALAAWLWMRMPRFGPQRPAPLPARRALLEHVAASGEHLYRYGHSDTLLAALRDAFWQHLRRRDPLSENLQDQARIAAIAARTGVPAAEVADALDTTPSRISASVFQRRAARLIKLLRR